MWRARCRRGAIQVNDDEHEGVDPTANGKDSGTHEVATEQAAHVAVDELLPVAGWLPAVGIALDGMDASRFRMCLTQEALTLIPSFLSSPTRRR